jgi:hypothetical protein
MPRFRVRTLMIVVGIIALLLGLIGPARQWYRRWSYHRSQVAWIWRLEQAELIRADQEQLLATKRAAIRATLMTTPDFAAKSPADQENVINTTVQYHQTLSNEARVAAERWREKRRLEETAACLFWDPYAPDVP